MTAVEFLVKQFCIYGTLYSSDIDKAKEIEKKQQLLIQQN